MLNSLEMLTLWQNTGRGSHGPKPSAGTKTKINYFGFPKLKRLPKNLFVPMSEGVKMKVW